MARRSQRPWYKPHPGNLVWLAGVTAIAAGLYAVFTPGVVPSPASAPGVPAETASTSTVSNFPGVLISFLNEDGSTSFAHLDADAKEIAPATAPAGTELRIEPNEDGAPRLTDGDSWNIALRAATGEAYRDARVLAQADRDHAVVFAVSDAPRILIVSRAGAIHEAYVLGEAYALHGIMDGAYWFSTAQPGAGIESPPSGPSSVIRVETSGSASVVTSTAEVVSAVSAYGEAIALGFEGGGYLASSGMRSAAGKGRPLAWLDETHVLIARDEVILLADVALGSVETVAAMDGPVLSAVPEKATP